MKYSLSHLNKILQKKPVNFFQKSFSVEIQMSKSVAKKPNPNIFLLPCPIFGVLIHKGKVILSGGGGGGNVGIPNRLFVYNDTFPLQKPLFDLSTEKM